MSYPGTERRERTALESSLIAQVVELEKERDELVDALRWFCGRVERGEVISKQTYARFMSLLVRYPK